MADLYSLHVVNNGNINFYGVDKPPAEDFDSLPSRPNDRWVIAILYQRLLDRIPPTEPLYGCSYYGQSVRPVATCGTNPQKAVEKRWSNEDNHAKHDTTGVGLYAVINQYGSDAFTNRVLSFQVGWESELQPKTCEEEKRLIAEGGGVIRDMQKRLHQTLNRTKGGKNATFEPNWALNARIWREFKLQYKMYAAANQGRIPPNNYVTLTGYKLGEKVSQMRQGLIWKCHPDREKRKRWLERRPGWTWNKRQDVWSCFQFHIQQFVLECGHAQPPYTYVTPDGHNLGAQVANIRQGTLLKNAEDESARRAWLESLPRWTWCHFDFVWQNFKDHLTMYVEEFGHASPPSKFTMADGYNLGQAVADVRFGSKLNGRSDETERRMWLESLPEWTWNTHDKLWDTFRYHLQQFVDVHGHARPATSHVTACGYALGRKASLVRRGTFLKTPEAQQRRDWLESLPLWTWNAVGDRMANRKRRLPCDPGE